MQEITEQPPAAPTDNQQRETLNSESPSSRVPDHSRSLDESEPLGWLDQDAGLWIAAVWLPAGSGTAGAQFRAGGQ